MGPPNMEGKSSIRPDGSLRPPVFDRPHHDYLFLRQIGAVKPNTQALEIHQQYPGVAPNRTLKMSQAPFGYAGRFTPCGKASAIQVSTITLILC
jgi:hypothetical protein